MQQAAVSMPFHKDVVDFKQVSSRPLHMRLEAASLLEHRPASYGSLWLPPCLLGPSLPRLNPVAIICVHPQRKRRLAEDSFAKATTALLMGNPSEANHHVTVSLCMLPTELRFLMLRAGTHRALVREIHAKSMTSHCMQARASPML